MAYILAFHLLVYILFQKLHVGGHWFLKELKIKPFHKIVALIFIYEY